MSLHTEPAPRPGFCDVIIAQFVFGPDRCAKRADRITREEEDVFYVCADHIAEAQADR